MSQNYHNLPVYQHRSEIIAALEQNQVLIVESPTGSGKTTQLPLILYEAGYTKCGIIGITQPRRIATLSVCDFISQQLQLPLGGFIGYKMRFEDRTTPETQIKVMTDGTLLQELKHDPLLLRYSVIMIDEAHERSLTIDFILGLLKDLLPKRPDIRLLVSSATIRTEIFSQYFFNAPVVSLQAKCFPVQVIYRPPLSSKESKNNTSKRHSAKPSEAASPTSADPLRLNPAEVQALQICDLILQFDQEDDEANNNGDVLVFLPGEANIKACMAALLPHEKEHGIYTLPLYARLSKEEQQHIFEAAPLSPKHQRSCRKVILATNIAETSITIDGVTIVIDTGLAKLSYFDSYSQHAELRQSNISKASAEQRKGRAGRVAPGRCYRLYSRADFQAMSPYTQEEIQRIDLTEVMLRMAELGIRDFEKFDFLTKPDNDDIHNAINSLVQLGALEAQSRCLSEIGKQMCYFPLLPKHSRILIEAIRIGLDCIHPACVITAFLSSNSPFLLSHGQEQQAYEARARFMGKYGDFDFYLRIYHHYSAMRDRNEKLQFCERYFLDQQTMHDLQRIVKQLKEIIRNSPTFVGITIPEPTPPASGRSTAFQQHSRRYHEEYIRACLAGLQSGLCVQVEDSNASQQKQRRKRRVIYRSLTAHSILIHPSSSMFHKPSKYLLGGEIMRTSHTYARSTCLVEAQWIDNFNPNLRLQLEQASQQHNRKRQHEKYVKSQTAKAVDTASGNQIEERYNTLADQHAQYYHDPESYLTKIEEQSGKRGWRIADEELLWLEQRFPLLNKATLLRNIRQHFAAAPTESPRLRSELQKSPKMKQKSAQSFRPLHLVPHIIANIEQLCSAQSAGLLTESPLELGIQLQFQGRLVVDGLMLSDLYHLFKWQAWDTWPQNHKRFRKEQAKLRSSYNAGKGRLRAERESLLKHLTLLFSPVCLPDGNGIFGLDTDEQHNFWFRPFNNFSQLLQVTCLALEALAELIGQEQRPKNRKGNELRPLPENLQCWLDRCESLL